MRKSPVIEKKIRNGMIPAERSRSFSPQGTARSSAGRTGPRFFWMRQRMPM